MEKIPEKSHSPEAVAKDSTKEIPDKTADKFPDKGTGKKTRKSSEEALLKMN